MSEEEKIIEDIKEIINKCKECKFATCEQCEINWTQIKTVEHLLDLYQKEKEKNAEIKSKDYKGLIEDFEHGLYMSTFDVEENYIRIERLEDYISKDKIKAKIEEIELLKKIESSAKYTHIELLQFGINQLQELLEEEE